MLRKNKSHPCYHDGDEDEIISLYQSNHLINKIRFKLIQQQLLNLSDTRNIKKKFNQSCSN